MSAALPLFLDVTVSLPGVSFTKVRRYTLVDALHTIAEMTVEVFVLEPGLDPAELVGQPATVLLDEPAVPRFDGIVRRVKQHDGGAGLASVFALTVVPRPWLTTERSGHRIFQHRNALDIVHDVLAPYGEAMDRPEGILLQHVLPTYEYRVQWGETDHDFLFRILAEHGLCSSWSVDAKGRRRWVVTDDTTAGSADLVLPFRPASHPAATSGPHVLSVASDARLCCSEVTLRDHDPRKPAFRLEQRSRAGVAAEPEEALRRYRFAVGQFDDERSGRLLATRRLEQARARSRAYRWETSVALRPGMRVRLDDAPRDGESGDFLVVAAWSEVDPKTSRHLAEVIPAGQPWRPEPPPKPRIQGTQTAFVVSPAGKEIDVDEQARILVHFPWDEREEGASRRVRLAMPWMGTNRGFWTLPRPGDEVVVAYLDGDPDQPLVVGSVNNAVAGSVQPLPAYRSQSWWKSKSTGDSDGYNLILMDDWKGEELIAIRAERDFLCDAGRNTTTTVGGSAALSVAKGQSVEVGGDAAMTVKGHATLKAGEVTVESAAGRTDKSALYHSIEAASLLVETKFAVAVKTDETTVTAKTVRVEAGKITLQAGSASIVLEDGKITLQAPLIELNP
jgi:type VI secretion system secreted protein VgrG